MMWSRMIALLTVLALVLMTGCASLTIQRVFSDEAELLAKRGEPTRVWANDDGTRTLEYSTQPMGYSNWMYTVDGEGQIVEQFDALSRANLAQVKKDMSLAEVQRLLGQHLSVQRYALSGEEVWDWNVANEFPGIAATHFNVHFIDGKVVRTSFSYVYPRNGPTLGIGMGLSYYPHWGPWGWGPPGWPGHRWAWSRPWGWPHYHHW